MCDLRRSWTNAKSLEVRPRPGHLPPISWVRDAETQGVPRLKLAREASSTLASADHMTGLTTCESIRIEEMVHNSVFRGPIWACPWRAHSLVSGTMIDHHIQLASTHLNNQSIHTSNSAFDWRLLLHTAFVYNPLCSSAFAL
jgi:hypothetical protein